MITYEFTEGKGDYIINTKDIVIGDEILFNRALFTGSYTNATYIGVEILEAKILKESYGKDKQQHTFTLLNIKTNKTFRIKGRNIYSLNVYRKEWIDEDARQEIADEKHERGSDARAERDERKAGYQYV